jgi:hypothetical protein
MIKTLLSVSLVLLSSIVFAQQENTGAGGKTEKLFYAEFGGANVLFGANFDWRFKSNTKFGLGARVGLGFTINEKETIVTNPGGGTYFEYSTQSIPTIPLGLNYVFGKANSPNMFEVGGGVTILTKKAAVYSYEGNTEGNLIGHFDFMYRRVPVEGGFSWRIGFVPVINTEGQIFPSAAIGLGYAFK